MDIRNYFSKKNENQSIAKPILNKKESIDDESKIIIKPRKNRKSKVIVSDESSDSKCETQPLKKGPKKTNTEKKPKAGNKTKQVDDNVKGSPPKHKKLANSNLPANTDLPAATSKGVNYKMMISREPPQKLGEKTMPQARDNCLSGMTFVLSGVLESFTREDVERTIKRYGGRITSAVSRKTDYLIYGRDCGKSKLSKAEELNTQTLDEDGFIGLLKTFPPKKSKPAPQKSSDNPGTEPLIGVPLVKPTKRISAQLLVDKYKPKKINDLIGQQGPNSCARKLLRWLKNWEGGEVPASNVDGGNFRAAILSGPPGIGKTTTAHVVCEELNIDYLEMNASDCRSKKRIEGYMKQWVGSRSLKQSFGGSGPMKCLIMDEVDGVAGNEDRGGIQELISCIKSTPNPIICICNNRSEPKIRTLRNYCYDLPFQRPRVDQIKTSILNILKLEQIRIDPNSLDLIIDSTNRDIRQIINNLSLWRGDRDLSYDDVMEKSSNAHKDVEIEIFEACRRAFSLSELAGKSMNDKLSNFFVDYSLIPLFMFENYTSLSPSGSSKQIDDHIARVAKAADAFCVADVMDAQIRGPNPSWELLSHSGFWSTVVPPSTVGGVLKSRINFPSWFGKYSTENKNKRLLSQIHFHSKTKIPNQCCSDLLMERMNFMSNIIIRKLRKNDINENINVVSDLLNHYCMQKEDMETMFSLVEFGKSSYSTIPTNVKSALTRARKKTKCVMPYSVSSVKRVKKRVKDFINDDESDTSSSSSFDLKPVVKPIRKAPASKRQKK